MEICYHQSPQVYKDATPSEQSKKFTKSNEFKMGATTVFQSGNMKDGIALKIYPQLNMSVFVFLLCHDLPLLYSRNKATQLKYGFLKKKDLNQRTFLGSLPKSWTWVGIPEEEESDEDGQNVCVLQVHMCARVCVCMGRPHLVQFLRHCPITFFDRIFHWPGTHQKGRLASQQAQGSTSLHVPSTGITSKCHHAYDFR